MSKQQSPSLRFSGFSGAWEEKKIIDIADYVDYRGKTPRKTKEGIFLITAKNVKMGFLDYKISQEFIAIEDFENVMNRGKAEIGDVLITTEAPLGNVAQIDDENVALAQRVIKYRGKKDILNNDFLVQKLLTDKFQVILNSLSSGGTVQGIKGSLLHQIEIKFPTIPEQTQIGHFFCHLDQLITESRAILEKSRQLKKAMLTKMFPAHGETMPKVRFKGFEGEWNRVIVGELGEIVTGNTPTTSDKENYKEDGLLWVTPTDIKEPITIKTMKYLSEKGKKSARLLPANSILVTCIASIGKNTLIEECGSCNQQINALIPKKEFYPYFLLTLSEFWSEKMKKIAGSGTMDIINKTQFSEIETILPSLEEQTQIGNFFRQLDETIALQQAELEKLSQFKKGLLATMLV